jgi:hypothetical protein
MERKMDGNWPREKVEEQRQVFLSLDVFIPEELRMRLETIVDRVFEKTKEMVTADDIVAEASIRFLPSADEIDALIEELPDPPRRLQTGVSDQTQPV